MKIAILSTVLVVSAFAAPPSADDLELAKPCDSNACKLPDCRCSTTNIPGGFTPSEIPQLVLLTFDDAVGPLNIHYYREAFEGRKNPDGCPVGTTYFVSHEYSDYSTAHELWAKGHEIALHSISHRTPQDYWKNLSVEGHMEEFAGLRTIINEFAEIPSNDMQGIRLPFLQLSGNNSFEMIKRAGLKYDCSWPTSKTRLWPYTLDYKSTQDCTTGPPCPTASLPGVWVVPMIHWVDNQGHACPMVDACVNVPTDVDGLVDFMIKNFNRHYRDKGANRAPFGFYVHAAWFGRNANHFPAYLKFLDYLQGHKDVYLVSVQRALQWVQKPSSLDNLKTSWPSCQPTHANTCGEGMNCELLKGEEIRYMRTCSYCPDVYPWVGNPLGKD